MTVRDELYGPQTSGMKYLYSHIQERKRKKHTNLLLYNRFFFLFPSEYASTSLIRPRRYPPDVLRAIEGVQFIAQHIKNDDQDNEVSFVISNYTPHMCSKVGYLLRTLHENE
jgi:hypothetical protein